MEEFPVHGFGVPTLAAAAAVSLTVLIAPTTHAETEIAKNAIAKAEAALDKVSAACEADLTKFCSTVSPGKGRLLLCMMAHEDRISDTCYETILDVADAVTLTVSSLGRATEVCSDDIDKLCGNVEPGEGRIAQCLIDNKDKLSSACSSEVTGFEGRIKK